MFKHHKKLAVTLLSFAAVLACLTYILASQQQAIEKPRVEATPQTVSQDIESKLSRKADFVPSGKSALDQLTEVAQHYQIPIGIEWIKQSDSRERDAQFPSLESGATVRDLLQAIVLRLPGYEMTVQNEVVHVAQPAFAADADNFLNVLIEEFQVRNETLLDAKEHLRLSIDMTLHPEEYEEGHVGGYGNDPDDVFAKHKINFTGEDLKVREILDGLVKASGNALWIAKFDADDFKPAAKSSKSSTAKAARNGNQAETKPKYQWQFVPLVEKPKNRFEPGGRP